MKYFWVFVLVLLVVVATTLETVEGQRGRRGRGRRGRGPRGRGRIRGLGARTCSIGTRICPFVGPCYCSRG